MMNFEERSFIGNTTSMPRPEIYFNAEEKLLIVATAWGNARGAKKFVETVSEHFLATRQDKDATSPFRRLEYLSTTANNLRISVLVGNEVLYREENRNEYRSGVELFVGSMREREVAWVQVGHPHILFCREGQPIMPLSVHLSLASEVSTEPLPPLPNSLLGISPEPNLFVQSIRPQDGDSLLLLSRSWIPSELFSLAPEKRNFPGVSKALSGNGKEPYWLGLWGF
jgi:hypothetical protein